MGTCSSSAGRVHAFEDDAESVPVHRLPKRLTAAFVGPSQAGKTTCIHTLARQRTKSTQPGGSASVITPPPSIKPATTTVDLDAFKLKCVDLPGNDTLRDSWLPAVSKADFLVFVVDSSQADLLPLARESLDAAVELCPTGCPPVLVLATKVDLMSSLSVLDVVEELDMRSFEDAYWAVEGCSNLETPNLRHVRDLRQAFVRFASETFGVQEQQ